MNKEITRIPRGIKALKVKQWLQEWEKVPFGTKGHKRRPDEYFYLFSLSASYLKMLTGIQRRTTKSRTKRSEDLGIQRRHEESRSSLIADYVRYGSAWSGLTTYKRESGLFEDLRQPGWLPTAIVVNILIPGDKRRGQEVSREDLLTIKNGDAHLAEIQLPSSFSGRGWKPEKFFPIEVIDGQHRLWAFEEEGIDDNFELPVVAFRGLDIGWQAYLFVTINIKPKRINMSLAYDLYPLLRTDEWLQKFEGHPIYRETRAQELVEALWSHPKSPWCDRINMLGEPGQEQHMATQAAWIRSLMATFIKAWGGKGTKIGGLFGAPVGDRTEALPWDGAQQAAFLILAGQELREALQETKEKWAKKLRESSKDEKSDPTFYGDYSLLTTDQGIRGFLSVVNDLCYVRARELDLAGWTSNGNTRRPTEEEAVNSAISSLKKHEAGTFLRLIAEALSEYDWRTSSEPSLSDEERKQKAALRGSGGYKELRLELMEFLSKSKSDVGVVARKVLGSIR